MSIDRELSDAIEKGDAEAVGRLLDDQPGIVNSRDWTPPPLHCAVLWNQPQIAELLLDRGANIDMLDPDRQTTALRYAVVYAKANLIPVLLSRGANAGAITDGGTTALELAREASEGAYEEFDDLPSRDEYAEVITALNSHLQ